MEKKNKKILKSLAVPAGFLLTAMPCTVLANETEVSPDQEVSVGVEAAASETSSVFEGDQIDIAGLEDTPVLEEKQPDTTGFNQATEVISLNLEEQENTVVKAVDTGQTDSQVIETASDSSRSELENQLSTNALEGIEQTDLELSVLSSRNVDESIIEKLGIAGKYDNYRNDQSSITHYQIEISEDGKVTAIWDQKFLNEYQYDADYKEVHYYYYWTNTLKELDLISDTVIQATMGSYTVDYDAFQDTDSMKYVAIDPQQAAGDNVMYFFRPGFEESDIPEGAFGTLSFQNLLDMNDMDVSVSNRVLLSRPTEATFIGPVRPNLYMLPKLASSTYSSDFYQTGRVELYSTRMLTFSDSESFTIEEYSYQNGLPVLAKRYEGKLGVESVLSDYSVVYKIKEFDLTYNNSEIVFGSELLFMDWAEGNDGLDSEGPCITLFFPGATSEMIGHLETISDDSIAYIVNNTSTYFVVAGQGNSQHLLFRSYPDEGGYLSSYAWPLVNTGLCFGYEKASDYSLDRLDFCDVFGFEEAYIDSAFKSLYSKISSFPGYCFGLSFLSLAQYHGFVDLNDYFVGAGDSLFDFGYDAVQKYGDGQYLTIAGNDKALHLLNRAHIIQYSSSLQDARVFKGDNECKELLEYLYSDDPNPLLLALTSGLEGHTVVIRTDEKPLKVSDNVYLIPIYDSNAPAYDERLSNPAHFYYTKSSLRIDTSTKMWELETFSFNENNEIERQTMRSSFYAGWDWQRPYHFEIYDISKLDPGLFKIFDFTTAYFTGDSEAETTEAMQYDDSYRWGQYRPYLALNNSLNLNLRDSSGKSLIYIDNGNVKYLSSIIDQIPVESSIDSPHCFFVFDESSSEIDAISKMSIAESEGDIVFTLGNYSIRSVLSKNCDYDISLDDGRIDLFCHSNEAPVEIQICYLNSDEEVSLNGSLTAGQSISIVLNDTEAKVLKPDSLELEIITENLTKDLDIIETAKDLEENTDSEEPADSGESDSSKEKEPEKEDPEKTTSSKLSTDKATAKKAESSVRSTVATSSRYFPFAYISTLLASLGGVIALNKRKRS